MLRIALLLAALVAGGMSAQAADADDKVRIVVMRLKQGTGVQAPADLLEVRNGQPEFIGRLWQNERLVIETTPDKKHYMTLGLGTKGEFFFAEPLKPGKTYYVVLRFHPGTGAIVANPVRPGADGKLTEALSSYKDVKPSRADRDAFAKERSTFLVQGEYERVAALYAKKDAFHIAERTLRAADAFDDAATK